MHAQLVDALGRLDAVTRDLNAVASGVPKSLQVRKPSPDRWSLNDVLEHLCLVEHLFVNALTTKIDAAKAAGLGSEVDEPTMLPEQLSSIVEDRSSPRKAPDTVQPTGQVDAASALQRIDACHQLLRDALVSADGLALSRVTHDHRFFGTLNVYQWIDLMAGHERRHLAQMREIVGDLALSE